MISVGESLTELKIKNWVLSDNPSNEEEFKKMFALVDGEYDNGVAILNTDHTTWGVTWEDIVLKQAELEYQEEVNEYQRQRAREYPSYADQFDQIYHEGVDAWKASIQVVKDKYPKQTMDADELQTRQDKAIFDLQTERYLKAIERLSQYVLLEGREEVIEEIVTGQEPVLDEEGLPTFDDEGIQIMSDITDTVITQTAIEPLEEFLEVTTTDPETLEETTESIRNPLVVKDEEERAEAQAIVDATPQSVIDSINN